MLIRFDDWVKYKPPAYRDQGPINHKVVDYLLDIYHYSPEEIELIYDNYSEKRVFILISHTIFTHICKSSLPHDYELSSALTSGCLCFDSKTGHLTGNFTIALHSSIYGERSKDNLLGTISYEVVFTKEAREPLIIPGLHPEAQKRLDGEFSDIQIIQISSNISAKSELAENIEGILTSFKNAVQQVQKSFRQRHPGIYRGLIFTGVVLATSLILAGTIAIAIFTGGIGTIIPAVFLCIITVMCGLGFLLFLLPSNDKSIDKSIEFISFELKKSGALENQNLGTVNFPAEDLISTKEIVDTVTNNLPERDNDCVELIHGSLKIVVSKTSQSSPSTSASTSSQNTSSYEVKFFGGQNFTKPIDLKPDETIAELCAEAAGQSAVPQRK